jgi:hypothetical protein
LLGQSHYKLAIPWQWWHLMSDVHPVGIVDDKGFAAATPCETEVLLRSVVRGAIAEGVNDVVGAREAKGVIEEQAPEGVVVLDVAVGAEQGVKEVFIFVVWHHAILFRPT